jgi:hypothetical protein
MSMQAINFAMTQPVQEPGPRLLLFVIAHHVHWQTGLMYVSQTELAKEVCSSERSVRRWLDYLEAGEYIRRTEKRDDRGHRQPDEIELIGYIEWQKVLYEGGTIRNPKTRGKAVDEQPAKLADGAEPTGQMVGGLPDKNGVPTGQGVAGSNEPLGTIRRTLSADERARDASAARPPRAEKRTTSIIVTRSDASWSNWLDAVDVEMAERMERAGEFEATSRWPKDGARVLRVAGINITNRMIGEPAGC